jgi:hypothetical protein
MKHKVTWEIKDQANCLIQKIRVFSDFMEACNFVREIKSQSFTIPILEEIKKGK